MVVGDVVVVRILQATALVTVIKTYVSLLTVVITNSQLINGCWGGEY